MKRYVVSYCSAPTGYSWRREFDRLSEFKSFIDEMRRTPSAAVDVWDNKLEDFIFWKDCFVTKPSIDKMRKA
jgi:hypothetical protein